MSTSKLKVFTGEVVRQFTHTGEFLAEIPDRSSLAVNDTINMTALGVTPDVLVNNTTYPIPVQESEDGDIDISLDRFQTKSTNITDDELESLPYDKVREYTTSHAEALEMATADKAAHALAPAANTAKTPIVLATGAANDEGHKSLTPADLVTLKKKLDGQKVPKQGRVLVLCTEHVADLLSTSEAFEKQYKDIQAGTVLNLYGFKIYEHVNCPKYYLDGTAWKKRAYGTTVAGDREASFVFHKARTFKARGTVKAFRKNATDDPDTQSTRFNFKLRFICLPLVQEAIAAIVSPNAQ